MYADVEQWTEIRRRVLVEGVSRRQILRETGMHWRTVSKILEHSQPPRYRMPKSLVTPIVCWEQIELCGSML